MRRARRWSTATIWCCCERRSPSPAAPASSAGTLIEQALAAGHQVRALTRRPQPDRATASTWIAGALDDADGARRAGRRRRCGDPRRRRGQRARPRGLRRRQYRPAPSAIVDAADAAGVRRFVHVSSLAAREPELSDYGWSKAEAERVVEGVRRSTGRSCARPRSTAPATWKCSSCSGSRKLGLALLPPAGQAVGDRGRRSRPRCCSRWPSADTGHARSTRPMTAARRLDARRLRARDRQRGRASRVLPLALPRAAAVARARAPTGWCAAASAKLTPTASPISAIPTGPSTRASRPDPALWQPADRRPPQGLAATAAWYRAERRLL